MNIIRKFMESGSKPEVVSIPSGQLYLTRSRQSPKSSSECLYNDATVTVRACARYAYELVVRKQAEEELTPGAEDDDEDDGLSELSGQSTEDEWVFRLDETLRLHRRWNKSGELTVVWRNTKGDCGEKFQFVVNSDIPLGDVEDFLETVYRCEYEAKYRRLASEATEQDLKQFDFSYLANHDSAVFFSDDETEVREPEFLSAQMGALAISDDDSDEDPDLYEDALDEPQPRLHTNPPGVVRFLQYGDLSVYDPMTGRYALQERNVNVALLQDNKHRYVYIEGSEIILAVETLPEVNPFLEVGIRSFLFNYTHEGIVLSYKVKFKNAAAFTHFHLHWTIALWEMSTGQKWSDLSETEQNYILYSTSGKNEELDVFLEEPENQNDTLGDAQIGTDEQEEEEEEEAEGSNLLISSSSFGDDEYDERRAEREYEESTSNVGNKALAVGFKSDRTFVLRGDKIGVFKTSDADSLDFVTAINEVSDIKGNVLNPNSAMLYTEDRALILQDENHKERLFKMDLERGKVVEEWVAGGRDVLQIGPNKKFDQLTSEQTFLGIAPNSVFQMDPRLSGQNKVVSSSDYSYSSVRDLRSLCTTQLGYVAVGSNKGEIRLYDKLGKRAKTLIPALGEPIRHLCASADGKWLLATCKSSILLFDTEVKEGRNAGALAYQKSFSQGALPQCYVLKVDPSTAIYMQTETGAPIEFTKATFNTGLDTKEQTITTSTGPFAMVWPIKSILQGKKTPYVIKKYHSNVTEESFKFGSDRNVIVALKDDISMAKKKSFRAPSRAMLTKMGKQKSRKASKE
ncbi:ABL168Cp [Eremothecium gossypii ATCC 10895]|uniref:ABL168Cp n=1 Tax=Eremothecium gossypii (strain ATCC 10895 / CBS 109.51 / FGSC 9923 / NRRL Y-1056) TaxID=284811 RepID=Q75E38_EREGS|nr:ABL168Cp [Eremothecium gossypii ATCC 10895]AAS50603.1 ABL168Cp [Eremothecium gossypii ATCC 10895]AEY94891.1 FABL168Cp [Eremothecium gossypii FDAG1]